MKQYFEENDNLNDDLKELTYTKDDNILTFRTNSGLFSREKIDEYSKILVDNIEIAKYDSVLDLGCGYGFVGITLTKILDYEKLTFIDVIQRACEYTKINCELNHVKNYQVIRSNSIKTGEKYNLIALNPPIHAGKDIVYSLYYDGCKSLSEDGKMYIVVHKKHGAKSTLEYLKTLFKVIEVVYKKKGIYVICLSN